MEEEDFKYKDTTGETKNRLKRILEPSVGGFKAVRPNLKSFTMCRKVVLLWKGKNLAEGGGQTDSSQDNQSLKCQYLEPKIVNCSFPERTWWSAETRSGGWKKLPVCKRFIKVVLTSYIQLDNLKIIWRLRTELA